MNRFIFQTGQKILFIGDSITDCGRRGAAAPLGDGYVKLATDLIVARYPDRAIQFINKGIGGDTAVLLKDRWADDVIRHRPDWLSIKVGINDLHRTLFGNPDPVPPDQFETVYRLILTQTRARLPKTRLILIDPFYISRDPGPQSRRGQVLELLPRYLAVVRRLVKEFKTLHVPTHAAFERQLKYREADQFCPEPVHPNVSGHLIIAHEFLKTTGW